VAAVAQVRRGLGHERSETPLKCAVPGCRGALSREQEDARWQQVFTAQPPRRRAFEPGADPQGPPPRGLDRGGVAQREELPQQRQGAAEGLRGAHRGDDALVLGRAAVGHDLRHRRIDRRQATPHRHGPKRGARTSTTPNSEVRRRGRRSFSGRCAPHRSQRRRLRQCSSTCTATRWRCSMARSALPSARPRPSVAAVSPAGGRPPTPSSCTCRVPSAPTTSSTIRHRITSPAHNPQPWT
jgi:hypothetical protein